MKQIEVVAAIIHDADGRIFATQRGYGDFKDFWEFPSGALTLKEHEEARWLSAHQLDSVNWLPADLQLLDEL